MRDRKELLLLLLIIRIHINDTCNLVPRLCSPLHLQHAEQEDEHSIHSYTPNTGPPGQTKYLIIDGVTVS